MRPLIFITLGLVYLLSALPSFAADDHYRYEYFSTLAFRESPYADIRGVVELNEAEAWNRNHYRFAYDRDGRLIEMSFRLRDALRPLNHTANYLIRSPKIVVTYEGDKEIRMFFDEHERPVATAGSVYREVYTLDDLGQRAELRFYNREGEPIESNWSIASYHWTTNPDGSVIETRFDSQGEPAWMRPGLHFGRVRLEYDAKGFLAVMQYVNEQGAFVENETGAAQDKLRYGQSGTLVSWNVLDGRSEAKCGNSPNVAHGLPTHDQYGYEIGLSFLDEKGARIRNRYGFGGSRAMYDQFGNMVRRETIDEHDNPLVVEGRGYFGYTFAYDRSGLMLQSFNLYGLNGEPALHTTRGYAGQRIEYNEAGDRTRVTYVGLDGQPVSRIDTGVAIIEHLYKNGLRTQTRNLNAAGKVVADEQTGWAVARFTYAEDKFCEGLEHFDAELRPIDPQH